MRNESEFEAQVIEAQPMKDDLLRANKIGKTEIILDSLQVLTNRVARKKVMNPGVSSKGNNGR